MNNLIIKFITQLLIVGAGFLLSVKTTSAQITERQDPAAIQSAVQNYLRTQTAGSPGKVTFSVSSVDSRLALAKCPALEVFTPAGGRLWGQTSVGVRCGGASPWTIYVTAQIKIQADYVVTARAVSQGELLSVNDVALQNGDITQLPASTVTELQQAVGKTATASLAAGQPVRLDLLRASLVVQQGQSVKLESSGAGFTVSGEGKALNNAAEGQVTQVRTGSGQTVSGIARSGGLVEVRY